jgi:hypothetical protein
MESEHLINITFLRTLKYFTKVLLHVKTFPQRGFERILDMLFYKKFAI